MTEQKIPLLSFFTGGGFLDIGFLQAGFDVVWTNDCNDEFSNARIPAMRGMRFDSEPCHNPNSIRRVRPEEILGQAFHSSQTRPPVFGVIGGPPCPDFSVAGKQRGGTGDNGSLSAIYVERILALRPTFFVFENVPGLVRTQKHKEFLDDLLCSLGWVYNCEFKILNSLEYGVPQDRERVFIIGFELSWLLSRPSGAPTLFKWPVPKYPNAKASFDWPRRSPFGGAPQKPQGIPDELMAGPVVCDQGQLATLPNGTEWFTPFSSKFQVIDEGDDSHKSFKRLHRWRYSPTASYGNNEVHLHPTEPRRLSVREALRLQTVPDEYALPPGMPLTHKFKMICNGVPVKLAYEVAMGVRKFMLSD